MIDAALMLELNIASLPMLLSSLSFTFDKTKEEKYYYRHRHTAYEIHYITSGNCELRIKNKNYSLKQGDLCLIAPGLYHSQKKYVEPFDKICLSFEISAAPPYRSAMDTKAVFSAFQSIQVLVLSGEIFSGILKKLQDAYEQYGKKIGGFSEIRILSELLILELARQISNHNIFSPPPLSALDIQRSFIIDEFFNDHFNLNDGDNVLSEKLCVCRRQLDRILKRLYGKSFREKLLEIRLEIASDLLISSDKSIAEISEVTGYSCPANFSTFLKNQTGQTPSELRQNQKQLSSTSVF